MLTDKSFRRTAHCSKYSQLVRERDRAPLITPFHIQAIDGRALSEESLNREGLEVPVVVKCSENSRKHLGLKLPPPDTSLSDIADTLGRDFPVKVIEVGAQHEIEGFTIGEYADYLAGRSSAHKLLNMISLEVSSTSLSTSVLSPRVVRQIDWIDCYWSEERRARADYPRVQKYVLAGMAGSYTDFHVDFGGTSVWYHIIKGCKVFYLIPPTTNNLRAYALWIRSASQEATFFPEMLSLGECKKVTITVGDTLMIPGGWIHAVYTPEDSLVIGGNFLFSPAIVPQLQVYSVEHRTRVSQKYRFPFFRQMGWYVLCRTLPVEMKRQGQLKRGTRIKEGSSSDSDSDSSEDEAEDEEDGESSLAFPRVGWGWPYLVKMAQVWVTEGLPSEDERVFEESARKCLIRIGRLEEAEAEAEAEGKSNVSAVHFVIKTWWGLLATLPSSVQGSDSRDEHDAHDDFRNYGEHLQNIQSYENSSKSFDVLNDSLFKHFPYVNHASSFYAASALSGENEVGNSALEHDSHSEGSAECKDSACVNSVKEEEIKDEKDADGAVSSPPLKLSLKINRSSSSPNCKTKAISTSTCNDISMSPVAAPDASQRVTKLVFKLKAEKHSQTAGVAEALAVGSSGHGQQWGHASSTTVTNARSRAARTFGTRGKRLSAGFLQHAADFEVGGDNELYDSAGDNSDQDNDDSGELEEVELEVNRHNRKRSRFKEEQDEYEALSDEDIGGDIDDEEEEVQSRTVVAAPKRRAVAVKKPEAKKPAAKKRGAGSLLKERLKKKFS